MKTVEISPGNLKAQLDLADLLLAAGKIPEARDRAQIVLQSEPQNAQAQTIVSRADAAQGDFPKALSEAQKAVQMDPKRPETFLNLAVIQEKSNDIKGAEQSYLESRFSESAIPARPARTGNFLPAPEALARRGKAVSSRDCTGSQKPLAARITGCALRK